MSDPGQSTPPSPSTANSSPSSGPSRAATRGAALVVTNMTKIAGLVIVVNEALLRTDARPTVLALAAFMMAGAQFSEQMVLSAIDRFFGRGDR